MNKLPLPMLSRSWRNAGRFLSCLGLSILATSALACGDDSSETNPTSSSSSSNSSSGAGGSGMGGNGAGGMGSGGTGMGGMTNNGYPAGPYGNNVGDTLAFLEFEGYVSPVNGDFGNFEDYSMLDIKNSGSPFVLIHLAAMF